MKFHEIAECFAMLDDDELEKLADDIAENGLLSPITIFEDQILDGRNRFLACQRAKVEPKTTKFIGDWNQAVAFVISGNLRRRHLTESQRGWAANQLANLKPGRPSKETGAIAPVSQSEAAKQLNVSRDSVKRAKVVAEQGVPELGQAVAKGEIAVSAAKQITKLPEADQREIVQGGPQAVKEAAAEIRRQGPERVLERRGPLSAAQEATRRAREAGKLVSDLMLTVKAIEQAVELTSNLTLDEIQEAVARKAITRMEAGIAFLKSALNGQKISADQALAKWLAEGRS